MAREQLGRACNTRTSSGVVTIECFAKMQEGDFGRCAATLPERARQRLFARAGGGTSDRVAIAKLSTLQVGVPECDPFVESAAHVLVCDAMAIEVRAQLGSETADSWSLPTSGLAVRRRVLWHDLVRRHEDRVSARGHIQPRRRRAPRSRSRA